jgi:dihydroxyacid dehydratase/phosphogluconate dehydratase
VDALVVLRGDLAPDGAVLNRQPPRHIAEAQGPPSSSTATKMKRMDDPDLAADGTWCYSPNAGPKGGPGMPVGQPPRRKKGVRDVCASPTHERDQLRRVACPFVAPEAAVGGPLALVKKATSSSSTSRAS